ncbi:MAG TPA: retron system putative HNH endonuclease [Allocoleopsis sp.]
MRYIKKGEQPESFVAWKHLENDDWKPTWNNFSDDRNNPDRKPKTDVHNALLQEQGYLCCYCGRRITKETSHIEHLRPRKLYPKLALEYNNLLASCQGESEEPPPVPIHCGHKKKDWYDEQLMVSPLAANCTEFFRYTDDGQILAVDTPNNKIAAQETIDRLDLNISKLIAMRRAAIEDILDFIDALTDEDIEKLIQGFEQVDVDGQYEEFCFAIAFLLKQNFIA